MYRIVALVSRYVSYRGKMYCGSPRLNVFVFSYSSLASPLKRNYTKEEFYTQAAQYADKGEKERIIVFSAPYRAASKKRNKCIKYKQGNHY